MNMPTRKPTDSSAGSDFTPEAATDAMHLVTECMALAGAQLRAGRLAQSMEACQRAHKALEMACISLTFLSGGLPR